MRQEVAVEPLTAPQEGHFQKELLVAATGSAWGSGSAWSRLGVQEAAGRARLESLRLGRSGRSKVLHHRCGSRDPLPCLLVIDQQLAPSLEPPAPLTLEGLFLGLVLDRALFGSRLAPPETSSSEATEVAIPQS